MLFYAHAGNSSGAAAPGMLQTRELYDSVTQKSGLTDIYTVYAEYFSYPEFICSYTLTGQNVGAGYGYGAAYGGAYGAAGAGVYGGNAFNGQIYGNLLLGGQQLPPPLPGNAPTVQRMRVYTHASMFA